MYTIDVDTGGTFTDGFLARDGQVWQVKVETTPHDYTVCFAACLEEGARAVGLASLEDLLRQTAAIRFSSTIATNTAVQLSGPKLGVLVTRGAEQNLYDPVAGTENPIWQFVPRDMVAGIAEEVDDTGRSLAVPDEEAVTTLVRRLLERGARAIVVSLRNAHLNPAHERQVREIVGRSYPRHYLGAVPVLLSSQVSLEASQAARTNAAVVNAYFHKGLARSLYQAEDDLRRRGYLRPLLVVGADGGVTRVAKTRALNTYQSGPTAGAVGAAHVSSRLGLDRAIGMDVGGTTTDISVIRDGKYIARAHTAINGVQVAQASVELTSIGVGGGSVAGVDGATGEVRVGPRSMGSLPGPACFGLGGDEATPTDAWLALGYLDPDYYLGGRRALSRERAEAIVHEKIGSPAGLSLEEAAWRVKEAAESQVAAAIERYAASIASGSGGNLGSYALFAFGGAGGLMAGGTARRLGIGRVYVFPYSPVFCAFGASTMDVRHSYEEIRRLAVDPTNGTIDLEPSSLQRLLVGLGEAARRDMRGEGLAAESIRFAAEVEVRSGPTTVRAIPIVWPAGSPADAVARQLDAYLRQERVSAGQGGTVDLVVRLVATSAVPHYEPDAQPSAGDDPSSALSGQRRSHVGNQWLELPVYNQTRLRHGNTLAGPALVESAHMTCLVPPGFRYRVDAYGNGVMEGATR